MRIPDAIMREWFELLTDIPPSEIDSLLAGKPNEAKKQLGAAVVRFYHGDAAAERVLADWKKQFEEKGDPETVPEVTVPAGTTSVLDVLVAAKLCGSKSEARKKVEEGAVNVGPDRAKVADWKATLDIGNGLIVRLGRKIVRVKGG
jgi:tyrosyl-tRNA synthetase